MLVSSLLVNLSARQLVYLFTRQLKKYMNNDWKEKGYIDEAVDESVDLKKRDTSLV